MIFIGSPDESVVRDVHQLPQILDSALSLNYPVNELLGGDTCFLSLILYLLTVLIGSGKKHYIIPLQSSVTGKTVRCHGTVGMSDMKLIGGIIDRCGYVIILTIHLR